MTDTPRCEPPEELRGRDGWHWVQLPFVAMPTPIAWMCNPDNLERKWRMPSSPAFVSGESKTAQTWRYIAPVTTPAEVDALRAERDRALVDWHNLRAEVARLREVLEAIAAEDLLLGANPQAFGSSAAYRMQEQARAALSQPEGKE